MKHWREVLIGPDTPVLDALKSIDRGALRIALVVDGEGRLLGTVTDGDVRSGLLRGVGLQAPASQVMCATPTAAREDADPAEIMALMRERDILQIPLLDSHGRVAGLKVLKDLLSPPERGNRVVLMAGGLGSRLGQLTANRPKPLIEVGRKPILETILENFIRHGFRNFYFSVNYLAEMIEGHFGDGSRFGARIEYLRENKRLGTAGALSLLPEPPAEPFFVMNGDILTNVDFGRLLDFHLGSGAEATMCVREYEFQVPYGVVRAEGDRLVRIEEKPVHRSFVNAGIYVLDPAALARVPADAFFDMPQLFERIVESGRDAAVFPIREYWLDIGRGDDLERAREDYQRHFATEGESGS